MFQAGKRHLQDSPDMRTAQLEGETLMMEGWDKHD
jgi:hypothetical protein